MKDRGEVDDDSNFVIAFHPVKKLTNAANPGHWPALLGILGGLKLPTGVVLLIKVPSSFDFASLRHLRERLVSECEIDLEDFRSGGPLEIVRSESGGPYPFKDDRVIWINSNLWNAYFDEEYPRGNIERIVMVADWCDQNIPECEIWYGHDIDDDNLKPFPPTRRQELVKFSRELRGRS